MTMVTTIIIVPEPGHVISEQLRDVGLKITLTLQVGMLRLREFRTRAQSTQAMKSERGFKLTASCWTPELTLLLHLHSFTWMWTLD